MNKQELQGAFSKIHASDELIKEVLSVEKEQKKVGFTWRRGLRLAATAAMLVAIFFGAMAFWSGETEPDEPGIVAVPGVMKVYACDIDSVEKEELPEYELTDSKSFYQMIYNPLVSARFCTPLTFQVPKDYFGECEITFEITSDYAGFFQNTTLENGENIMFDSWSLSDVMRLINGEVGNGGEFFLDIIIRADGELVGYGVVSFCFDGPVSYAYESHTVCFPMVDGQFQNISIEYVLEQIDAYKQAKVPGEGVAHIHQVQNEKK